MVGTGLGVRIDHGALIATRLTQTSDADRPERRPRLESCGDCGNNRIASSTGHQSVVMSKPGQQQPEVRRVMEQAAEAGNNRELLDRRDFSWRTVMIGFLRSRRRAHRRDADPEPIFTDWHHPWLFFLSTGIMLLSSFDAFFTLRLLERGASEVNPVMLAVMGEGTLQFAVSKMLLTGLGILALVFLSRSRLFNLLRAGLVLTVFFSFYCCLVCYEFVMLINQM